MTKLNSIYKHMRRSPYQALAAIFLTSITFFIVSVFTLTFIGAHQLLAFFESKPQVTAFFHDESTPSDSAKLESAIRSSVNIVGAKYISKDEALEIYKQQNQDNPLLLAMVTADILPASLEVSAKNVNDLETIATIMSDDPKVEEVIYQKDVIDTLKAWIGGLRAAGLGLSTLLFFASLTTLIVILGLRVTSRKVEIKTLSLLGASPWYIRGPFIYEGIFYSVVGAVIGWSLSYIGLLYLTPDLVMFLQDIPLLPVPIWVMGAVLGVQVVLALILGFLASLIATRRYGR